MGRNGAARRSGSGEQGSLGLYLRELRRIPLLSVEEEQACARSAARGDEKARQRLIQANLRFVILVAKRYRNHGVPMEDLVNEGNIGLIRAAGRFDPDRGIRFVSYAVCWIRQAILKAIRENGSMIRVPRGRPGELPRTAALRLQAAQPTLSLDSQVAGMENPDSFAACLEDAKAPKPEEVLLGTSLKDEVASVLAGLSDREASIVRYRYGLGGGRRAGQVSLGHGKGPQVPAPSLP